MMPSEGTGRYAPADTSPQGPELEVDAPKVQCWQLLGPGPGKNEELRELRLPEGGKLIATVLVKKGYSNTMTADDKNVVITTDEITRAMAFIP